MKPGSLLVSFQFLCFFSVAQTFDIDTLQFNGAIEKHINLVILSDGYTVDELDQFVLDAKSFSNALFDETPFDEYANLFNVFIIKVPSNESGADHPGTATDVAEPVHPVIDVDNHFGSTFDFAGIHRLLVATNGANISAVLANNFPSYDQALILVNSPHYGGSGGAIPVSSTNTSANEIAIHEIGHSFAQLADEYWAGDQFAGEATNMTQSISDEALKWKNWRNYKGVGVYQHCCGGLSANWYKPHQNCKMQFLGEPFCAVCIEGIIESIHDLIGIDATFLPEEEVFSESIYPLNFEVSFNEPLPSTLKIEWLLNDISLANEIQRLEITEELLKQGTNFLKLIVHDTTSLLRVDNHETIHFAQKVWTIKNGEDLVTGIEDGISLVQDINIKLYPNPSQNNQFTLKYDDHSKTDLKFVLFDIQGKMLQNLTSVTIPSGESAIKFSLDNFPGSAFILQIIQDGKILSAKRILKQ